MNKILVAAILAVLFTSQVQAAQSCEEQLMGLGVPGLVAAAHCSSTGTISAEQLTSTDDATVTDDLAVGGNITGAGEIKSTGSSLGWTYETGANTACTTTCGAAAAVFGVDLAAGASAPVIVGPTGATADACVCAGSAS